MKLKDVFSLLSLLNNFIVYVQKAVDLRAWCFFQALCIQVSSFPMPLMDVMNA